METCFEHLNQVELVHLGIPKVLVQETIHSLCLVFLEIDSDTYQWKFIRVFASKLAVSVQFVKF